MPKAEGLSSGLEAANSKTILKAKKRLAAIAADLEVVQQLLDKVDSKEKRGRPASKKR